MENLESKADSEEVREKQRLIIGWIRTAKYMPDKERHMLQLGDMRLREYRKTRDARQLRLAKNCYLAARLFYEAGNSFA